MRRGLQANGHFGRLEANFRSLRIETWGLSGAEGRRLRLQNGKHYNAATRGCMHTNTAAARHLSLWPLVYR